MTSLSGSENLDGYRYHLQSLGAPYEKLSSYQTIWCLSPKRLHDFSTGAAHAADESDDDQTVDQQQLNEHQVQLEFSDYSFEATDDGEVEAINLETGETEAPPEETTDANGNEVALKYGIEDDNTLIVTAVESDSDASGSLGTQSAGSDAKCWLGIVGSGVGGGLAGAATGSAVPVIGTAAGAVSGVMAGNAVGTVNYFR
ncbi:hypothetical protein QDX21_01465 [Auritidibacter ignavus]|uniref:Uncharacterized protein n=1 Tax=Auritidibacter ignavus TaxID=678932 RepID=A0AAJ6DCU6_9MICC|nr:hypothetical protein [Auritidibacter ignavus]WGH93511.1 hypothetical protein QDX21_01465 [Auritidibacter ignavus]